MGAIKYLNSVCPKCGAPDMISLDGVCENTDALRIKCINCNSYFTIEEIYGKCDGGVKMDAVEYLRERKRMLQSGKTDYKVADFVNLESSGKEEQAVRIVYWWNKRNPVLTNAQKFEEVFGVKPTIWTMSKDGFGLLVGECDGWWDEPYEEPEK